MIEIETAKVYRSTFAGRRYFSKTAAIKAEARAVLDNYYPYEPASDYSEHGRAEYPGDPGWRGLDNSYELFAWVVEQIKGGVKSEEIDVDAFK